MKNKLVKLIALAGILNFSSCGLDNKISTPELLLVEESANYMKELFKTTAPEPIIKHLLPEVDKVKDENKARWSAELTINCNAVEINIQKEGNQCRIKAISEGAHANPKLQDLRKYTRDSCYKIIESVSENCNKAVEKILEALYIPAEFGHR